MNTLLFILCLMAIDLAAIATVLYLTGNLSWSKLKTLYHYVKWRSTK